MKKSRSFAAVSQAIGLAAVALCVLLLFSLGLGPRTGRYRTMTVLTASMRPNIPEGSVIFQTPMAVSAVRVGHVITYNIGVEDQRVVTHRVVEVIKGGPSPVVRTKGDANRSPDPWVARLQGTKVWSVQASVPKLGYVLETLRRPQAKRLTLLIAPLFLALVWLKDIWGPRPRQDPAPARRAAPAVATTRRWQGLAVLAALAAVALVERQRGHRA